MQFATEFGSFVFLVTGNLVYKCQFACQDGSRVPVPAGSSRRGFLGLKQRGQEN